MTLNDKRIGFAFTGSFCTLMETYKELVKLCETGASVWPIFSYTVNSFDTRFTKASEFNQIVTNITGHKPITTICEAEPIGPKNILDAVVIAPCTGNTLAKLANGITDTPVLMAAKAQLRNGGPILIAVSSNDALGANGQNIGKLMNVRNVYFVPMKQDAPKGKPDSLVAEMENLIPALEAALEGKQINPVFV